MLLLLRLTMLRPLVCAGKLLRSAPLSAILFLPFAIFVLLQM
jgi:hypothetical protein